MDKGLDKKLRISRVRAQLVTEYISLSQIIIKSALNQ